METYFDEYFTHSYINGEDYNTTQNIYPTSYTNFNQYNISPTINYSNNFNFNDFNNNTNNFSPVETSFNTFKASNNFNVNNGTYGSSSVKILPPIYIPNNESYLTSNINYNISELSNNNFINNNYINNNYQPTYQNISYNDNTDNNMIYDNTDTNMINPLEFNNTSHPLDAFLSKNILEMTATSSNTFDYGTSITPITYNNNDMESSNYVYTNEFNRQKNVLFRSFEPVNSNHDQNPNLISQLRNSYFNDNDTPYSIFSYNPNQTREALNYSSLSNDFLNEDMNIQPKFSVSSFPMSYKLQNGTEVKTEIVPVEEIELIPVKKTRYVKRTTIKYPIIKSTIKPQISTIKPQTSTIKPQTVRRSLIKPMSIRTTYYVPKDVIQPRNNIQVSSRPSSPIRNSGRLEPLSPSSSYRSDYPYDNYVGAGIYSPRVYRINLNEKKGRRRKFY